MQTALDQTLMAVNILEIVTE